MGKLTFVILTPILMLAFGVDNARPAAAPVKRVVGYATFPARIVPKERGHSGPPAS